MRPQGTSRVPTQGVRLLAVVAAVVAALAVATDAAAGPASKDKLAATEVGVTSTEIHIAVVADVDNPIAANLFIGPRDAVLGFARYVNSSCATPDRCLAGRKLVVDFYDSKLDPNTTTNAEIQACSNDIAMVGTAAVFLTNVDDMRNCKDRAGGTTGIPDIPDVSPQLGEQCSDESFPIVPPTVRCNTRTQHPQTFDANVARGYYFTKQFGNLHGIYILPAESKAGHDGALASGDGGLRDLRGVGNGIHSDGDFDLVANAPQSAYAPVVQRMKEDHSNYAQCTKEYSCTVELRKEAVLQGIADQVKVWDCTTACYDRKFLQAGGADVEREYVDTLFLPFFDRREQHANPMVANFVQYTGNDKVDGLGAYAWSAAVAFRDAVNATVQRHGLNGLTRAGLLASLNHIHEFDADGMLAPIDLAGRKTSDCHVLIQVRNGAFVRVQPTKPGTFDCSSRYVITRKLELLTSS